MHSHYDSLKVTRDAPPEVIRAAYRSLSQKHHPDKNSGNRDAAKMMTRLNAAYSVLSDSDQRAQYDLQILGEQRAREKKDAFQAAADEGSATAVYTASTMDEAERSSHQVSETPDGKPGNRSASVFLGSLLPQLRHFGTRRDVRVVAMVLGGISIALIPISWLIWKENQSMQRLEQAAIYATDKVAAPDTGWPGAPKGQAELQAARKAARAKTSGVSVIEVSGPSGLGADTAELAKPAAAPKPPPASASAVPGTEAKASEYERLTAMLKSMGLGLHKLDPAAPAPDAKQPAAPSKAAEAPKALETAKAAETAKPGSASAPPAPAAKAVAAVAAPDMSRAREETERPAAPDPVRSEAKVLADASRASSAPAASATPASASHAPRAAVVVDARNCALPKYPINAYLNGDSGTVLLALLVASDGKVLESKVQKSSGFSELDKAARKALSLCKFKPADGQAEPAWATLTYVWNRD